MLVSHFPLYIDNFWSLPKKMVLGICTCIEVENQERLFDGSEILVGCLCRS